MKQTDRPLRSDEGSRTDALTDLVRCRLHLSRLALLSSNRTDKDR